MTPTRTTLRLARPGGEWNRLYAMAKRAGGHVYKGDFTFPTVVAERDGVVIGFLATQPTDAAVVAGPLVIEGTRNPFLFIRLVEAYENVLRAAGVKAYLHTIDKDRENHVEMMERLGFTRLDRTPEGETVMRRDLL